MLRRVCHAPRERVSWNFPLGILNDTWSVTLHVSVWVEIYLKGAYPIEFKSRSTWACELKFSLYHSPIKLLCHAPRERVSWNVTTIASQPLLLVTLHVSVWVEMLSTRWYFRPLYVTLHVSVWVEIAHILAIQLHVIGHAPRERVSWNFRYIHFIVKKFVTLHVSVWVEIRRSFHWKFHSESRSTWACELKFVCDSEDIPLCTRHAPRERVSWNRTVRRHTYVVLRVTLHVSVWVEIWDLTICSHFPPVTLHVSVWVEICFRRRKKRTFQVTLHVSVWVEIIHSANLGKSARVTLHVSVWVEMLLLD